LFDSESEGLKRVASFDFHHIFTSKAREKKENLWDPGIMLLTTNRSGTVLRYSFHTYYNHIK